MLNVRSPEPEKVDVRWNQRKASLETEKGTAIRGRLGGSLLDSLRKKNEGIEAVLEVVSERPEVDGVDGGDEQRRQRSRRFSQREEKREEKEVAARGRRKRESTRVFGRHRKE
jgi:hypothetical protein